MPVLKFTPEQQNYVNNLLDAVEGREAVTKYVKPPYRVLVTFEKDDPREKQALLASEVISGHIAQGRGYRDEGETQLSSLHYFFWTHQEASVLARRFRDAGYNATFFKETDKHDVAVEVTGKYNPEVGELIGKFKAPKPVSAGDILVMNFPTRQEADRVAKSFRDVGYPASSDPARIPYL